MDCVDTRGGGARSIDCFILFAWQTGDLMWLVSRRSVSDDARRDCYRWRDSDTSQSLASRAALASTTFSSIPSERLCMCHRSLPINPHALIRFRLAGLNQRQGRRKQGSREASSGGREDWVSGSRGEARSPASSQV